MPVYKYIKLVHGALDPQQFFIHVNKFTMILNKNTEENIAYPLNLIKVLPGTLSISGYSFVHRTYEQITIIEHP